VAQILLQRNILRCVAVDLAQSGSR